MRSFFSATVVCAFALPGLSLDLGCVVTQLDPYRNETRKEISVMVPVTEKLQDIASIGRLIFRISKNEKAFTLEAVANKEIVARAGADANGTHVNLYHYDNLAVGPTRVNVICINEAKAAEKKGDAK